MDNLASNSILMKYLFLFLSTFAFAQQTKSVDFKTVKGHISINPNDKSINGEVIYTFEVLKPIDTIKIDAQNMIFTEVELKGKKIPFIT